MEEMTKTADEIIVKIIKDEDGDFHLVHPDGEESPKCKIIEEGRTIVLPKNAANRQYCAVAKANAGIEENGCFVLTVRTTEPRKLGAGTAKLPNEKLISYLPEAEQEEYRAIIARAIAAREAERNKPLTEQEKAQRAYDKAVAKLEELKAQLAAYTETDAE